MCSYLHMLTHNARSCKHTYNSATQLLDLDTMLPLHRGCFYTWLQLQTKQYFIKSVDIKQLSNIELKFIFQQQQLLHYTDSAYNIIC